MGHTSDYVSGVINYQEYQARLQRQNDEDEQDWKPVLFTPYPPTPEILAKARAIVVRGHRVK